MIKKTTYMLLFLMLIVLATACGKADPPPLEGQPADPIQQGEQPKGDEPPVNTPEPPTAEEIDNSELDEQETEQVPEPVVQNYHMNKNYFIVPNDPEDNRKVVLLTFDDGPKEEAMISDMLETLEQHDAKAIFFVNGYRVQANPELLQMLYDAGHAIGNHSWDHINLRDQDEDTIDQQIEDVQTIVEELTGEKPQFFRPPFGSANDYVREKAKRENMLYMTWSNGSLDWDSEHQNPDAVIQNVMEQLNPGSNILMHELPWTVEALDRLLTKIAEEGYSFIDPRAIELRLESPTQSD